MAELPSLVRVKRKRGDEPTADLFLEERTQKKQQVWQFRLQQAHPSQAADEASNGGVLDGQAGNGPQAQPLPRREFRLARPFRAVHDRNRNRNRVEAQRKRKAQPDPEDIPVFVEATQKRRRVGDDEAAVAAPQTPAPAASTLKRPGANAKEKQWRAASWSRPTPALTSRAAAPPPDRLADALHRFALEEEARDEAREKHRVTSVPKKPVQRFRDRNPAEYAARTAHSQHNTDGDMDMSDDEDYVYDTYVRTKEPVIPFKLDSADPANDHIGYIVISEEDLPLWETYFEEEETDKEFDTDDDDENAEGHYAADYPEDEVASDDEFDRGAYGYRHGGSDDEQWDSDPNEWSADEDAMQNPWKKFPWMKKSRAAAARPADDNDDDDDDGERLP